MWRRGVDFDCVSSQLAHGGRVLDLRTPGRDYDGLYLPLFGAHQGLNASIAVVAAEAFFGEPLDEDVVTEAFAAVTVPGRLEVVGHRPLVVLDGAHNAAGAIALGQALREDFSTRARTILVMGCLAGRAPQELLEGIGPDQISEVIACRPDSPRAQPAEAVVEAAESLALSASAEADVADALAHAFGVAEPDDLIVVTGSLYVVGAARQVVSRLGSSRP
jgi:dihydrofolate synthase/folylpolyglutamate synthase